MLAYTSVGLTVLTCETGMMVMATADPVSLLSCHWGPGAFIHAAQHEVTPGWVQYHLREYESVSPLLINEHVQRQARGPKNISISSEVLNVHHPQEKTGMSQNLS